uniref:Factor X activator light chain 1 n=3 Tax=Daboia TaxID=42188 RepID=K9JAX2_DABRR|nr:factor X activator light chain 1 [Daboia russelii russelii]ADK22820.1 factor X activator light chain 1 [Daboia siamensis]
MGRFIFVSFGWLVVFLSLSGTEAVLDCPSGWLSYEQHCYKGFNDLKNWTDAEKFCTEQKKGSHLVSLHSREEEKFVVNLISENLEYPATWIGLGNMWKDCRMEWSDRGNVKYKALAEESYCLIMITHEKVWKSMTCNFIAPVVCKF